MLRVCETSDVSLWAGYEISSEETNNIFLKIADLKSSEVKKIVEALVKMLSNFDDGEYIALKASSFFECVSEVGNDIEDYIVDYDHYATTQFIEWFEKPESYDDDDDDDNEDDDDDEYDYDNYIDTDSIDDLGDDCTEDYMVRFLKNNDTISIKISNDISMIDMTLVEFLFLYQ